MDERLRRAVEAVYAAFEHYPLRSRVEACPHCVPASARAALRSAPLRRLPAGSLRPFAARALNTWGEVDDLRHFLPRMLELGALDGGWDLETTAGKLCRARWREWPRPERDAVEEYFGALWRHVLTCSPRDRSAAGLLDMLGDLFPDTPDSPGLAPFLAVWREETAEPAMCQMAELVLRMARASPARTDGRVLAWLAAPQTRDSLEAAFFQATTPSVQALLSAAHEGWTLVEARAS